MSKTKLLLMNAVSLMTIVSTVTACCCPMLPSEWQPQITIDMGEGEEDSTLVPTSQPQATVGPMATPGAPSAAAGEIVSQTEISPDEFMQRVQGDEEFADVYALASEQGYTERETAGEFTMSDGTTLDTLVLRSPAGQRVVAFRLARADCRGSLLVRAEGETLILYDRDARAEMTAREQAIDIKVFDAAGNPIGETALPPGWRPPALASARQQQGCIGGRWEDFDHCCRQWVASGVATTVGCMAAWAGVIAACITGGWALPVAVAVFLAACPFAYHCMQEAEVDNLPTFEVKLPGEPVATCSPQCYTRSGKEGVLTRPKYRIQVAVDDDRPRRPASPQYIEACAGDTQTLVIKDCAGQTVEVQDKAPDWESSDWTECTGQTPHCWSQTNTCVQCRPDQADCPQGQTCVNGQCVGTGDVRVTLVWRSTADIDLHVIDPNGEEIYYNHTTSASGGQLDVDDQCDEGIAHGGPENIFWPAGGAPRGEYQVLVVYYEECSDPGEGPAGWTVTTLVDGQSKTYSGTISPDDAAQSVATFTR